MFLRGSAPTQAAIERIESSGVRIALSDFGLGYASLGYLRGARFSNIKLDRSFIVGASRNAANSLAMIRAVVAMADSLGIAVTAEGTETESEYELIRRLGCSQAQGYLFGHPVPAARSAAAGRREHRTSPVGRSAEQRRLLIAPIRPRCAPCACRAPTRAAYCDIENERRDPADESQRRGNQSRRRSLALALLITAEGTGLRKSPGRCGR